MLEREPNDSAGQAQPISIPSVVEGMIGRPGDVDSFKFAVKPGEKLRLRFGVWIHSGKDASDKELENMYQSYIKLAGK